MRQPSLVSARFYDSELVPPEIFNSELLLPTWYINKVVLVVLEKLKDRFGAITVNNWHAGGQFNYCGYRPQTCTTGAVFSMHRLALAADTHYVGHTPEEVRQDIRDHFIDIYKPLGLTTIESNCPEWVHFDARWMGYDLTKVFEVPFQ
jgi:hypothetical protein